MTLEERQQAMRMALYHTDSFLVLAAVETLAVTPYSGYGKAWLNADEGVREDFRRRAFNLITTGQP